jgi:hypothetical protein
MTTFLCLPPFILQLSSDGTKALAATYFNGTNSTSSYGAAGTVLRDISVDQAGNIAVGGVTGAANLPLKNPLTSVFSGSGLGSEDSTLLIARFSSDLSTLQFSSFINPPDYASGFEALTTDRQNHILVAGGTLSKEFPTTTGAFQPVAPAADNSYSLLNYQFLASIDPSVAAPSLCFDTTGVLFGTIPANSDASGTVNLTNCGNAALTLGAVVSSSSIVTTTNNCTAVAPGSVCQLQLTYSPTAIGSISGTVSIAGNMAVSPEQITFSGAAGAPSVSFPTSISFDDLLVGQTGAESALAIYNTGNAPFIFTRASVNGDFQIVANSCTSGVPPNSSCEIIMSFSPTGSGTRSGTLSLQDNLVPTTQTIQLIGHGLASAPVPMIACIPAIPQIGSGTGQVVVYGSGFFPNSTIYWNGSARATTYAGEGALVAALTAADLQQVGEGSVTVTTPAPGGGTSAAATATIYGRLQNIQILHEAYNPVTQMLFATVANNSANYANSLVVINPVTMQVVSTLLSGGQPDALALSSDASMLYVSLDSTQSVAQLSLPAGTVNFTVQLPLPSSKLYPSNGIMASALAVIPGKAHSWVVGLCNANVSPCGVGVAVYDDSTPRPTEESGIDLTANSFTFASDPAVVYSTEFNQSPPDISSYAIASSGVTLTATSTFDGSAGGGTLASDGNLIYVSNGQVINPATLAVEFTYPQGSQAMALDNANQRLFFAGNTFTSYDYGLGLTAVDKNSEVTVGAPISFPEYGSAQDVQRFGAKGIVIDQGSQLIFLQSSLVTASAPSQPLSFSPVSITFASQAQGTTSAAQSVTLSNSSSAAVGINGLAVTGNFAQTNNCGASLAAGATCKISVTFSPEDFGLLTGDLTVTDSFGSRSIALSGTGVPAPPPTYTATVTPGSLTFAAQAEETTSPAQSITITNTGTGPLDFYSIEPSGDFAQTNNCGQSLAAGATCNIHVTFTPTATGARTGTITVVDNATTSPQQVSLTGTGTGAPALVASQLQFVPITPCRIADTRNATGAFGGPELAAGVARTFDVPQSGCGIPSTAVAYSLNVTVVPIQRLGYLTMWPAGLTQPTVSTLNSDGRVKANATITPAGTYGGVSVFASDATQFILDIDGYFVPAGTSTAGLEFYPLTPCRIADTRNPTAPLGGPSLTGGVGRAFPVPSSACGIPSTAKAYSLNITAVPHAGLGYLTTWPTGQAQPVVSTLNSSTGAVTANAAIVPAGSGGEISVFVSDTADLILDVNGYFAPPATGGLSLYTVTPCRALDTRSNSGAFDRTLTVPVHASSCAPPATAQAYVLNATVIPANSLSYLTLWAAGGTQPVVSTLNASDGAVTSNMAIVRTSNGSVDAFATDSTQLILDLSSYFAP